MDLRTQTTTAPVTDADTAYRQIRTLADKQALLDLSALYSMAVDDHDLPTVVDCFAPDGTFTRLGATVAGHADLTKFYRGMMERYTTTLHVPNTHVTHVDSGAGSATGIVTGHAELALDGRLLVAAYRYDDTYSRLDDRWVFQSRTLRFMYNVPVEEMGSCFGNSLRMRVPGAAPAQADFPESFPTWQTLGL